MTIFFLKRSIRSSIEALKHNGVDFVTPFEHKDYNTFDLHNYEKTKIKLSQNTFLVKVGSTTCTFLTTKQNLIYNRDIFLSYTKGNWDVAIWMSITKLNAFNFSIPLNSLLKGSFLIPKIYLKLYSQGLKRLFKKTQTLYCLSPAQATHLETGDVSPGIDWEREFQITIALYDIDCNKQR